MNDWEKQEKMMLDAQMDNEIIYEIFTLSFRQYKRDRSYYIHKFQEEIPDNILTISPEDESDYLKGLLQTDNQSLLKGLETLSKMELKVILLFSEQAMGVSEISSTLNLNYATTSSHLRRAKKKLKNFLKLQ